MVDASCDKSVNQVPFNPILPFILFYLFCFSFLQKVMRLGILPDTRHASEVKSQVLNSERLGQAEDQSAF